MSRLIDLTNKRFGTLLVLKRTENFIGSDNQRRTQWECLCDCGKTKNFLSSNLIRSLSKNCGCVSKQLLGNKTRKSKGESGFNSYFKSYKDSAKAKNIQFLLTKEEFKQITLLNCFYCGESPNQRHTLDSHGLSEEGMEYSAYYSNGIDRIDSDSHYMLSNIVSCCSMCNYMKVDYSVKEFLDKIKKIYSFQKLGETK